MPATRMMIARRAGVSVATVDRVLRDDQGVRPETAERVHLALATLRDERASRGRPAKATSFRVAFVLPQINSRFLDQAERDIALSASFDVVPRVDDKVREVVKLEALPDLGLPKTVEAFDAVLKARLAWGRKDRNDPQSQTQTTHSPDGVRPLMSSLEDGIVVELREAGQTQLKPALNEAVEHTLGANVLTGPSLDFSGVQRGRSQYRDQRSAFELKILDHIQGVQLRFALSHRGQVPAAWRRRAPLAPACIHGTVAHQNAADSGHRGHELVGALMHRRLNGRRPVFAQYAALFEFTANAQHTSLRSNTGAIPRPWRTALVIIQVTPIQPLTPTAIHPKMHCANRHAKALSNRTDWLTISNRSNHLSTTQRLELFFSYGQSSKKLDLTDLFNGC